MIASYSVTPSPLTSSAATSARRPSARRHRTHPPIGSPGECNGVPDSSHTRRPVSNSASVRRTTVAVRVVVS